jgi:hypothetical protein
MGIAEKKRPPCVPLARAGATSRVNAAVELAIGLPCSLAAVFARLWLLKQWAEL